VRGFLLRLLLGLALAAGLAWGLGRLLIRTGHELTPGGVGGGIDVVDGVRPDDGGPSPDVSSGGGAGEPEDIDGDSSWARRPLASSVDEMLRGRADQVFLVLDASRAAIAAPLVVAIDAEGRTGIRSPFVPAPPWPCVLVELPGDLAELPQPCRAALVDWLGVWAAGWPPEAEAATSRLVAVDVAADLAERRSLLRWRRSR
jgi:hypothetical protein